MLPDPIEVRVRFRRRLELRAILELFVLVSLTACLGAAFLLGSSCDSFAQQEPTSQAQAVPDSFEEAAEAKVLELLGAERQKVGVPPLELNRGLSDQARLHALQLAQYGNISSEFPGELDLIHRLQLSNTGIAAAAEVEAIDRSLEEAHAGWIANPVTHSNALKPMYTDVGVGVLKHDGRYYIVVDLVEAVSKINVDELEAVVVKAIQEYRIQHKIRPLKLTPTKRLRTTACEMAQKADLNVAQIDPSQAVAGNYAKSGSTQFISFTVVQPNDLPSSITHLAVDPNINAFSVGACQGKKVYYVTTAFYGEWLGVQDR
jgi:hypothetical protein